MTSPQASPAQAASLFSTLPLHPALLENLQTLGYSAMTPIQCWMRNVTLKPRKNSQKCH